MPFGDEMRTRGICLLAMGLLVIATACDGGASTCMRDTDCGGGLSCLEGRCGVIIYVEDAGTSADGGGSDAGNPTDGGNRDAGDPDKCTDPEDHTTCTCDVKADCTPNDPSKAQYFICTAQRTCIQICLADKDCANNEVCEDSQCRPPACGSDAECNAGQACIDSQCRPAVAASDVKACDVLAPTVTRTGVIKALSLSTRDANGTPVPYKGAVTWSSSSSSIVAVSGTSHTAHVTGGASAGSAVVGAWIGELGCSPVVVANHATRSGDVLRVVVVDQDTGTPIQGATVKTSQSETATTDAAGVVTLSPTMPVTISVFEQDHAYVTLVDVVTPDILVATPRNPAQIHLQGAMTPRAFDKLPDFKGTVHTAFFAAAPKGSWMDFRADTALGTPVPTHIDLGGSTQTDVDLHAGMVVGIAEDMFKDKYWVDVPGPGVYTLWGSGGNMVLSDALNIVSMATSGGDVDFGAVNAALIPLTDRFYTSIMRVEVPGSGQPTLDMKLTSPKRLRMQVTIPTLPTFQNSSSESVPLDQVGVFAGSLDRWNGFAVLGSAQGFDQDLDGTIDPASGGVAGVVPVRVAGLHGGLETSKYGVIAIASNTQMSPPLFSGEGEGSERMALTMLIARPGALNGPKGSANVVGFGRQFLPIPEEIDLDEATRQVTMTATGASFRRLDVGDANDPKWYVYLPSGSTSFTFPSVPSTMTDRFAETQPASSDLPAMYLHHVDTGGSLNDFLTFGGQDMDHMNDAIGALSSREVVRSAATP